MKNINYFYITSKGATMRVWFVDAARKASVVATGSAWDTTTAAWNGGKGRDLLPVLTGAC